jgi:polysaccharide export outer membrane protein
LALKIGVFLQMSRANLRATLAALAVVCLGLWAAPSFAQTDAAEQPAVAQNAYRLDTGDQVKMTVYGEDDLSGTYPVDGNGNVQLPLIGQIHAGGLSITDFQSAVEAKLSKGFLVNPRVSAEVANYRPFTILGEVNKPGEYPYENGMSVLNAVALAGGYTYRADEDAVYIRRKGSANEVELPANDKTLVNPGDTVRVTERIF